MSEKQTPMIAIKLSAELRTKVLEYTDIHREVTVSQFVREGLELRLRYPELVGTPGTPQPIPASTLAMLEHLAATLATAAAEVRNTCRHAAAAEASDGYTDVPCNGNTDVVTDEETAPEVPEQRVDETASNSYTAIDTDTTTEDHGVIPPVTVAHGHTDADRDRARDMGQKVAAEYDASTLKGKSIGLGVPCRKWTVEHAYGETGQTIRNDQGKCVACNRMGAQKPKTVGVPA